MLFQIPGLLMLALDFRYLDKLMPDSGDIYTSCQQIALPASFERFPVPPVLRELYSHIETATLLVNNAVYNCFYTLVHSFSLQNCAPSGRKFLGSASLWIAGVYAEHRSTQPTKSIDIVIAYWRCWEYSIWLYRVAPKEYVYRSAYFGLRNMW